jgi:hypothetical protein
MFVIRQYNENNVIPFKVQVSGSKISNAVGGAAFSNIGGELSLEDVTIDSSTLMSVLSTGSLSSNEGSSFLRRVTVTNSSILVREKTTMHRHSNFPHLLTFYPLLLRLQDIFVAFEAADIDAMDITISNMMNIETVFDIAGDGSTVMIENMMANNNDIGQVDPPSLWVGINIRDEAKGIVTNSSFINNTNFRHVYSASNFAVLDVQGSMVDGASGGRVVVSHLDA